MFNPYGRGRMSSHDINPNLKGAEDNTAIKKNAAISFQLICLKDSFIRIPL